VVNAWRQANIRELHGYWASRYQLDAVPLRNSSRVQAIQSSSFEAIAQNAALSDAIVYLPDDILVKMDRAAMANSLETRAPLLDHRIVEFALRLPKKFKLTHGTGKRILRDVLYRHVPRSLVDRPKVGFGVPLGRWLREELRDWATDILAVVPQDSSVLDREAVQAIWREHVEGVRDRSEQLWAILSLIGWCHANGVSA
jgi:asparagine synthase (glutamine-hydrolysing)